MAEVGFLPDFFGRGTLPSVSPVDGCILLRKSRLVIKPVVENEKILFCLCFPENRLTKTALVPYNHTCFTVFT